MKKINVTQPSLPSLEDFIPYLETIWENRWLTNNGPFHQQFEVELAKYLGVKYVSLFSNGTLALIASLQVLKIKGEVITTPYTFVATPHSLYWNNIKPVFCDINPNDCNIDVNKIESLITPETTAILPVHVYGAPCDTKKIDEIARTYGLKVIYDSAHAFGVKENGDSILNYGDLSVLSFHATKIFNTFEGGAIVCHDKEMKKRIDYIKNFGFEDEITVVAPGINAKMNEFQSALGILQLKNIDNLISSCKEKSIYYIENLKKTKGIRLLKESEDVNYNYSYFPIFVENNYPITRDNLYQKLKDNNIYARRYFYPLVTKFSPYRSLVNSTSIKNALQISEQVICLPMYPDLEKEHQNQIIEIINGTA
ncbi:MAG: aminotransferase [Bacteroidetes bacterium GWF2_33_38]|nr:MAG: aminotransferase [Bacteroidetes bacterium GWF2_33_38]OFY68654.1 MAG: aminotransferase [Bacteroidetes bacterium RIFOXYA12_FULL_33_9]